MSTADQTRPVRPDSRSGPCAGRTPDGEATEATSRLPPCDDSADDVKPFRQPKVALLCLDRVAEARAVGARVSGTRRLAVLPGAHAVRGARIAQRLQSKVEAGVERHRRRPRPAP